MIPLSMNNCLIPAISDRIHELKERVIFGSHTKSHPLTLKRVRDGLNIHPLSFIQKPYAHHETGKGQEI